MKIYVKCTRNGETVYGTYEGMPMNTVEDLLKDLGATDVAFIDQSEYEAANPRP